MHLSYEASLGLKRLIFQSLAEVSIAQIYFSHERGFYIGIYALSQFFLPRRPNCVLISTDIVLFGSNFLAPALAGYVFDGKLILGVSGGLIQNFRRWMA
jgi:hypothetical protein